MKYLKWLLLLPVAAFPYVYFVGNWLDFSGDSWTLIGFGWLPGLVAAALVFLTRNHWTAKELALANMLIKLVQIPAYVIWFAVAVVLFLFMGALIALVMDGMAIILSGLVGLAAVLRCRKEGQLAGEKALLHGILQFVFCADVVSAVLVYRESRRRP